MRTQCPEASFTVTRRAIDRRTMLALSSAVGLSLAARASLAAQERRIVYLAPLGPTAPGRAVELAESAIQAIFGFGVRHMQPTPLPRSAFYAPRQRYRADVLLATLAALVRSDAHRVVGVTAVDISTTKGPYVDWGILGLARIGGPVCVVSSYRCGRRSHSAAHAAERLAKVVVHELGHTLGLPHCTVTRGCIMEDAGGSALTTDTESDLCDTC